jgi:predicted regulator of Ras-like GTPase activity (Roadblock/LC7/MglB family)
MAFVLSETEFERVRQIILELLVRSESDDCLVCDSGGYVLAKEGMDTADPFLLSALGAGVFAASRELARILGEDEFSAVFHQGEKKSIFIRAVNHEILLVDIFSKFANIGLVKLYATPAATALRAVFDEIRARGEIAGGTEKHEFVLTEKQDIFGSKP